MMGGIGVEVYNDLKVYDFATKEWKHQDYNNVDVIYIPDPRFGHSICKWNNHLVCFAGSGDIIPKMKSRKTFADLRLYNLGKHTLFINVATNEWVGQDFSRDGIQENKKRVNHAAAIMGGMLVVHGGFNSDENYMYNQIEVCDLSKIDLELTFYSL